MLVFVFIAWLTQPTIAADETSNAFLQYVKRNAVALRVNDQPPPTLAEWKKQRGAIRKSLLKAWGGFPEKPSALEPRLISKE